MNPLRAGLIYAIGNVASAAVPFLLLPLLTRVLRPSEYGHVIVFALLVTLCFPFAGFGVHSAVSVGWFSRPHKEMPDFVGTALALVLAATAAVALVVAAVLAIVPEIAADLSPVWGALAVVTSGANVIVQCRLTLWQSQQRPVSNVVLQFFASLLNVVLSLIAVLAFALGAEGRNGGIAVAAVISALCAIGLLFAAGDARLTLRRDHLRSLLLYGAPLIPHALAGALIGTADRWIVSTQLGAAVLGIYGAGAQLGLIMSVLADAFVKSYNPWLYARLASKSVDDRYCVVGAIYLCAPGFIVLGAAVGITLYLASTLLLGAQYRAAVVVLPWFMLGGAVTGVYFCVSSIYFFAGRTGLLAAATSFSAVMGLLLIWLLVPLFGIEGAAMGYAATQILLAVTALAIAMRTFDLPWREPRRALAVWTRASLPAAIQPWSVSGATD
jgi:O-antigen/teichoic acid export membrane protein